MPQRKLLIILALIVALPLGLLAWQGWKISENNKTLNNARFNDLVSARLNQVDTLTQGYFDEVKLKWSLLIPQWKLETSEVRQIIDDNGMIRQIFVINKHGKQQFPPVNRRTTRDEKDFVNRLELVWRDPEILFSNQSDTLAYEEAISLNKLNASKDSFNKKGYSISKLQSKAPARINKKASLAQSPNIKRQGWYRWYWGSDANLIYWQQDKSDKIIGIEIEPVRIKADLISRLPDTLADGKNDDFRMRLLDTAGQVVYQWGSYKLVANDKAQQKRSLSYPLSSWSLEYYGKPFNTTGMSRYALLTTLLGFGFVILALAWFLYREQTREMRLASQRVNFVSQVSHELKTPLTNIRLYAEMLEDHVEGDEKSTRYLNVITDESKRLTRLIANVLNFSRAPRFHIRRFNPDQIVRQSLQHFSPSFEAKGISVKLQLSADLDIDSDPDILEQILNNLLSNVDKYAAKGKHLDIQTQLINQQFILTVRDYGDGFSKAERKHIFKPFYRVNNQLTEGVSGTGIGLTIARQQAEHLNGKLEAIDVSVGACFQLTLPIDGETLR